jgi:hypothetical protein
MTAASGECALIATASYPSAPDEGPAGKRMQPLRLIGLACLGSLLLGTVITICAGFTYPAERTLRGLLVWLAIGISMGLLHFLPIAVVEALRPILARRLRSSAFHIQWYVSLAMALGMGYFLASIWHATFGGMVLVAVLIIWLCAWTKLSLSIVFRTGAIP